MNYANDGSKFGGEGFYGGNVRCKCETFDVGVGCKELIRNKQETFRFRMCRYFFLKKDCFKF